VPSNRHVLLAGVALLAVVPALAAAQPTTVMDRGSTFGQNPAGSFFGVLIVGALALAVIPDYVERLVERIRSETGACLGWGIVVGLVFVFVAVVLALSVVGIVLLIPLAIVFAIVAALANAVGYLALFAGVHDNRGIALLLGAAIAGLSGFIPIVGQVLGFIVGSLGLGAVFREWNA
jgi:hypothetical protein